MNDTLAGKTLGIVGLGNVGRRVARFAGALGMRVLGYDKYVADDEMRRRGAEPTASLEALLPQVDVLTCHTPLTEETRAMINPRTLGLMKRGVIFINTSRGPVHDERAVFEALATGQLGAADRASLVESQHQANRWTYLGAGMSHPEFLATVGKLMPAQRARLEGVAPAFS